jgi:hypothetical protein
VLEQQTATSEVLRVISSSPTDVQPVFTRFCAALPRPSSRGPSRPRRASLVAGKRHRPD